MFSIFRLKSILTLSIILVCSLHACVVNAQTNWINLSGGSYHTTSNWSIGNVPNTAGESAEFNLSEVYDVSFFAADNLSINALSVLAGDVTLVSPGIATYSANDVVIAGGDLTLFESATSGRVDLNANETLVFEGSMLAFDAGSQSTTNTLRIGGIASDTVGGVSVLNGASLDILGPSDVLLGLQNSGTSSMLVDGVGSMLRTAPGVNFFIGVNSGATFDVTGGATVTTDRNNVFIGNNASGSQLTVDGGSIFTTYDLVSDSYGVTKIGNGLLSTATVEVLEGSTFVPGELLVEDGSNVIVDGSGSMMLVTSFDLLGQANVVVSSGAQVNIQSFGGDTINGASKLTVMGPGTKIHGTSTISLTSSSAASPAGIYILDGAVWEADSTGNNDFFDVDVSTNSDAVAEVIVDGVGSTMNTGVDGKLSFESTGNGITKLKVANEGTIITAHLNAALSATTIASIQIESGTVTTLSGAQFGAYSTGSIITNGGTVIVDLLPGGLLDVEGNLVLGSGASFNLNGGELRMGDLANINAVSNDVVHWNNGIVSVLGNATLTPTASALLLPDGKLGFGQELRVVGDLTLQSTVILDGGTFATEAITNASLLQLVSGTFEWLSGELIIGTGEVLGGVVNLGPNLTLKVSGNLSNQGLITGDGILSGSLFNNTSATIRLEQGKSIDVVGSSSHSNAGEIQILGGQINFSGVLNNQSGGNILGRGTFSTENGLNNQGDLVLSNNQTDVFGSVNNQATGRVIISGNADVTFWDDVDNAGEIFKVSQGSSATFFGTFSGAGISGSGNVFLEADVLPGFSPAEVIFGGDVMLGSLSNLVIELGGTTLGMEYDTLSIAGIVSLEGSLDVKLIDLGSGLFSPTAGDAFKIISAEGGLLGTFDSEILPALSGGLEWVVSYTADSVVLEILATSLAADFDADGDVDGSDFLAWQTGFGISSGATHADGDADGNGIVNSDDFNIWQSQFATEDGSDALSGATVPEPSSIWLFLLLTLNLVFYSRRIFLQQ